MSKPFKSLAFTVTLLLRSFFGMSYLPSAACRGNALVPTPGEKKPTLEEQVSSLTAERDNAVTSLTTITGERDTARTALASMTTERDNLQNQFNSLTTTSQQLQTDLTAARAEIGTLTSARDTALNNLTSAQANVKRLETLCQLKGIDPKSAIASEEEDSGAPATPKSAAEFQTAISAAKTQAEKDRLMDAFSKAVKAGTIANG